MRILTLQAALFADAWRREHDVLAWGLDPTCDFHPERAVTPLDAVLAALPAGWTPDRIVLGDDRRLLRVTGLEHAPCPTALVSLDPRAAAWHAPLAAALDVAFVAQRALLPQFTRAGATATWLPPWAPDDAPEPAAKKAYGVAFVGKLDAAAKPRRAAFLEALRARVVLHAVEGRFEDVYPRSSVVVDHAEAGELNARIFQAMACGALVLAPQADNGLLDLFGDGEHLIAYPAGDVEGLVAALVRNAGSPAVLVSIAERGREAVRAAHLHRHRAAAVLDAMAAIDPGRRRPDAAVPAYAALAVEAARLARRDPTSPLPRRLGAAYRAAADAHPAAPRRVPFARFREDARL